VVERAERARRWRAPWAPLPLLPAARLVRRTFRAHPSAATLVLALGALILDFAVGRNFHFPLGFMAPVAAAAWMGQPRLAYLLSIGMPLVRVWFYGIWQLPDPWPMELVNAVVESCVLALYVPLVRRQGELARQMRSAISAKDEAMEHLRAFTRSAGTTLQGRPVSPGLAEGVAFVYRGELEPPRAVAALAEAQIQGQLDRLDRALQACARELEETRTRYGEEWPEGAELVEVRLAMVGDPDFAAECQRRIREDRLDARGALVAEIGRLERGLQALDQSYLASRSADIRDLGHQILRHLADPAKGAAHPLTALPPGAVVVADELLLSDALHLDLHHLAAIVTERTGPASHVAILARLKRIPCVCDIKGAGSALTSGEHLLVDADQGTVTVAPTPAQGARFAARKARSSGLAPETEGPEPPCVTRDGIEVGLLANIAHPDEAVMVLEHGLKGVGLFRSEIMLLDAERPLDLDPQAAAFEEVAAMLYPRPVVIRTMDLGGDKIPRFAAGGGDPALASGLRGLAYSLAEGKLFRTQLRAIARAARRGNIRVLFPMVMGPLELREACDLLKEALAAEGCEEKVPVGAMIETPAAAFRIDELLEIADFVSLGTNDLSHSILAMDRGAASQDAVSAFLHPTVLRVTEQVVQSARRRGVALTLCGEAAADPTIVPFLLGIGVTELSLSPFFAARVRRAIRDLTLDRAQSLAKSALGRRNAAEVRRLLSFGPTV
jgi:phosphotransferase system enzyme I (PtsI)